MTSNGAEITVREINPLVRDAAEHFLLGIESAVPNLLDRAHVTGSALTDDWQPSCSDIDLVFVVTRPVTAADASALSGLHAGTKTRNAIDGVYLTAEQLAAGPDAIEAAPQVVNGQFTFGQTGGQLCWVTWQELAAGPVATVVAADRVQWSPPRPPLRAIRPRLEAFCRQNLATYWANWGDGAAGHLASMGPGDPIAAGLVVWAALGPPRLIATIRTGAIVSKKDAGLFAATAWPDHADLIHKCIRSRRGETEPFTVAEMRAAIDLLRLVVAEGTRR